MEGVMPCFLSKVSFVNIHKCFIRLNMNTTDWTRANKIFRSEIDRYENSICLFVTRQTQLFIFNFLHGTLVNFFAIAFAVTACLSCLVIITLHWVACASPLSGWWAPCVQHSFQKSTMKKNSTSRRQKCKHNKANFLLSWSTRITSFI